MRRPNDKGVAMTVVVIIIIIMAMLATYVTTLGYNQKKLASTAGGRRAKIYYRAQAGTVEAAWRIRTNNTLNIPVGNFTDPNYAPHYQIDVDEDGIKDCDITISRVDASGKRQINSIGLDV